MKDVNNVKWGAGVGSSKRWHCWSESRVSVQMRSQSVCSQRRWKAARNMSTRSRVARHTALAAKLGVRRRKLGAAVVTEPPNTCHPPSATATTHAATAVCGPRTCRLTGPASGHRDRTRRAVAVASAVAVATAIATRLARRSIGTVTTPGGRHEASSTGVPRSSVLRAAAITTS